MVVILQPASRRPFSMLPVTIFTAMTNDCQQDAKASSLVNRVTSCLFSFVVEFANNGINLWGGGGKTVAPKICPIPVHSGTAASSVAEEDRLDLQS